MLHCKFFGDYNSERIFKIGQYLTKLCAEHLGFTFLAHPVYEITGVKFCQVKLTCTRWTANSVSIFTQEYCTIHVGLSYLWRFNKD